MPTVGILYTGEMGSALGRVFLEAGLRVVTTLEGRSPRTQRLGREAGLDVLPSLRDVVRIADIVVSVVLPSAALGVAKEYAALAAVGPSPLPLSPTGRGVGVRGRLYVDANAVSPATEVEVGRVLADLGVNYVDAAIHGVAARLRAAGILYLSGARAPEVAALFGRALRVQVVGDVPGKASALKGALTGLSKSLTAMFVEMATLAREAGLSEFFLDGCRHFYPGVMEAVGRMLPTYPRHARRRAEEMEELEDAMRLLGLKPSMARAAGQVIRAMAEAHLEQSLEASPWTAERVLEALHASGALRMTPARTNNIGMDRA